jgi:hypothetical protein
MNDPLDQRWNRKVELKGFRTEDLAAEDVGPSLYTSQSLSGDMRRNGSLKKKSPSVGVALKHSGSTNLSTCDHLPLLDRGLTGSEHTLTLSDPLRLIARPSSPY